LMWILFSCCDDFVLTVFIKHFTVKMIPCFEKKGEIRGYS
jgi:hypothetical protein